MFGIGKEKEESTMHVKSENVAVPEVTFEEDQPQTDAPAEVGEDEESEVDFSGALPQLHFTKVKEKVEKEEQEEKKEHMENKVPEKSMNPNRVKRNDLLAQTVIKGLESRNMHGYYAKTREEALKLALKLIPEESKVTMGGSMSVGEIGLKDAMKNGNYQFFDRDAETDKRAAELFAYDADFFLGSANAITNDGILVNIDGNSNRVSAYAYGPKHLILIVGMNKIADDLDGAMKRARGEAATMNAQRFNLSTPCCKLGKCMDCKSPDTICCNFLITRYERHKDRVHVILVNDELGF